MIPLCTIQVHLRYQLMITDNLFIFPLFNSNLMCFAMYTFSNNHWTCGTQNVPHDHQAIKNMFVTVSFRISAASRTIYIANGWLGHRCLPIMYLPTEGDSAGAGNNFTPVVPASILNM